MSPTSTKFRIDGPPYPKDLPFYQTEALVWFSDNANRSLPWQTNAESVELVKRFYEAGAQKVEVIVENADRPIPFINTLEVFLPVGDVAKRAKLIAMARTESQLEAQPHMENKDMADEVHRVEDALAKSNSEGPVSVWWEIV